jgi:hypothetical protein
LLVVMSIIALLIALLLPAVQMARESARRAQCRAALSRIGIALFAYHDGHQTFPPGYVSRVGPKGQDAATGWCWAAFLLPHLEHGPVYRAIQFERDELDAANRSAIGSRLEVFHCPSDPQAVQSNYVASFGRPDPRRGPDQGDGMFFRNSRIRRRDVKDGPHTFLVGERSSAFGGAEWTGLHLTVLPEWAAVRRGSPPAGALPPGLAPLSLGTGNDVFASNEPDASRVLGHTGPDKGSDRVHGLSTRVLVPGTTVACRADFSSPHATGVHFLLVDGSVRFVSANVHAAVFAALATRAGGEPIGGPEF